MSELIDMPMFPLGMVLFPTQPLPLRVFEPRYQQLTHDLLQADGRFGVVLIERGLEVGGGDVRSSLGCVAQLVQARQVAPGRFSLLAMGVQRLRVAEWLLDDPYPRARVEVIDEPDEEFGDEVVARFGEAKQLLRRTLALASELGYGAAPTSLDLSDDPRAGSFQLCSVAPIGPLDRQQLLAADSTAARIDRFVELVGDAATLYELQLAAGSSPDLDQE